MTEPDPIVFLVQRRDADRWVWVCTCDEAWSRFYASNSAYKITSMPWSQARGIHQGQTEQRSAA